MSDEMKNFVGYVKNRSSSVKKEIVVPAWANSMEMAILALNLAIILVGLVVSATISDITSPDSGGSLMSFFGRC